MLMIYYWTLGTVKSIMLSVHLTVQCCKNKRLNVVWLTPWWWGHSTDDQSTHTEEQVRTNANLSRRFPFRILDKLFISVHSHWKVQLLGYHGFGDETDGEATTSPTSIGMTEMYNQSKLGTVLELLSFHAPWGMCLLTFCIPQVQNCDIRKAFTHKPDGQNYDMTDTPTKTIWNEQISILPM